MSLPHAEKKSYWKTSRCGVENWLEKTEKIILDIGGIIETRLIGMSGGNEAIFFVYSIGKDRFRIVWPILPTKSPKDGAAAFRQAATMVFHDTKSRINRIRIFGPKVVFSDWLIRESGKTLAEKDNNYKLLS